MNAHSHRAGGGETAVPGNAAKIVITGTGRAGTTFLVQLLTELGLDTGYTPENWRRDYEVHCAAGLEHDILAVDAPRIVKNPALCLSLPGQLARREVKLEHAIVPMRALEDAARSRIWIGGRGDTPGGLWGTADPGKQQAVLADNFFRLVHALAVHEVPHTFLAFPRLVKDADYTWVKLSPIFPEVGRAEFLTAFARVARAELVHDFSKGVPLDAGRPGRDHRRLKAARARRRRALRVAIGAVISFGSALVAIKWVELWTALGEWVR